MVSEQFKSIVLQRISDHKAEVALREKETRDRIRKEEQTNLANSQIEGIRQQVMIASIGRAGVRQGGTIECIRETLAETEAWVIDEAQFFDHVAAAQAAKDAAVVSIRNLLIAAELKAERDSAATTTHNEVLAAGKVAMENIAEARREGGGLPAELLNELEGAASHLIADSVMSHAAGTSKPVNVVPMRAAAAPAPVAAPATPPTMKLGDINALLSPISLTADGLTKLGFPPAAVAQSAKLYHAHDLTNICAALHDLLDRVQAKQAA